MRTDFVTKKLSWGIDHHALALEIATCLKQESVTLSLLKNVIICLFCSVKESIGMINSNCTKGLFYCSNLSIFIT